MRGRVVLMVAMLFASFGCSSGDDSASSSSDPTIVTVPGSVRTVPVGTETPVTVSPPTGATPTTVVSETAPAATPEALVEDCVEYVPTAVYFGNFYMQAIWDLGGGTVEGLRGVCEGMVVDDLPGLQRMSDELHALKDFVETTTTQGP